MPRPPIVRFWLCTLGNHIHLIAKAPELSKVMRDFKSFMARSILDLLKQRAVSTVLRQLRSLKRQHKQGSEYQVWQAGFHPKQIDGETMMWQKLEYIHNNPVERGFVDDPRHWRWSSVRNYAGLPAQVDLTTNWR